MMTSSCSCLFCTSLSSYILYPHREVIKCFYLTESSNALKSKTQRRLSWNGLSKAFPFILMEPMLKPLGKNSQRASTTSLSPPHLPGDLHEQQVCHCTTKINPETPLMKVSYVITLYFLNIGYARHIYKVFIVAQKNVFVALSSLGVWSTSLEPPLPIL